MDRNRAHAAIGVALLALLLLLTFGAAHVASHGGEELAERCATCKAVKVSPANLSPCATLPSVALALSDPPPYAVSEPNADAAFGTRSRAPPPLS